MDAPNPNKKSKPAVVAARSREANEPGGRRYNRSATIMPQLTAVMLKAGRTNGDGSALDSTINKVGMLTAMIAQYPLLGHDCPNLGNRAALRFGRFVGKAASSAP
jgi:hypothetical protein